MSSSAIWKLLRGPFNFLEPTPEEIRRFLPSPLSGLPTPNPIYLADETATPFHGFPVLISAQLAELREALEQYIAVEEEAQLNAIRREPFSRTAYSIAWERYLRLLLRAVENAGLASYGRHYPTVFWLHHSLDVAQHLRDSPKRVLRFNLEIGRRYGDQIKYRVYEKYREQVRHAVYATASRLATELQELDSETAPPILKRMLDNVLVFTEDHISSDLAEISSYFNGYLGLDAREMRQRLERLVSWHATTMAEDWDLRAIATHVMGANPDEDPRRLIFRSGYVSYLSTRRNYSEAYLLPRDMIQTWETLLLKLKEFELYNGLRQLVLPVRQEGEQLVFRAGGLDRTWIGQRQIYLSAATRPLDFMSQAVIDPLVHRFGLIYDISQFSEVISMLRRSGQETQERAFRQMFLFQRQINRLAGTYRLQLEKYLGDGAFYTSRHPLATLLCSVHLQRLYRRALENGLPFDHGMRIGLNFGHYRLIPIQTGADGELERYEFFGHGVVELSRLTSGKSGQEIEEIKNTLLSFGYPPGSVERFFEPLAGRNLDVVDKGEESRTFFAYINRNGTLINEGIVATAGYIAQLEAGLASLHLYQASLNGRSYVVLPLEDGNDQLQVGFRRLGIARLKGLDELAVYEVIDGIELAGAELHDCTDHRLLPALDRLAAAPLERRTAERRVGV